MKKIEIAAFKKIITDVVSTYAKRTDKRFTSVNERIEKTNQTLNRVAVEVLKHGEQLTTLVPLVEAQTSKLQLILNRIDHFVGTLKDFSNKAFIHDQRRPLLTSPL